MSPLARRYRRLLLAYPRDYRRERADELVDTLLATSRPGRRWPGARVAANLVRHGLRARLGRPASRGIVVWSVLAALACGLFAAAGATLAAWQTSHRRPDGSASRRSRSASSAGA